MNVIEVEDLVKEYALLPHHSSVFRMAYGRKRYPVFKALDGVSFSVGAGKVLGVIGGNGSGKSTLLKILTGVVSPTSGKACVRGKVTAILEVSTGFNPMASGRANIRRYLSLYGHSEKAVDEMEPEIIEFSELEEFIDQPLLAYSSGMAAKLAFSIVTAGISEVLLVDELLSVGDEHFQGKSFRRMQDLCKSGRTIVLVSHSMDFVERLCDDVIWLDHGKIRRLGDSHSVVMDYHGRDSSKDESSYPKEYGRIADVALDVTGSGTLRIVTTIERLKEEDDLHIQVALYDHRYGIKFALLNSSEMGGGPLPSKTGFIAAAIEVPIPGGVCQGLAGVALARGSGRIPGSVIEDSWGWSNGRQVYFTTGKEPSPHSEPYLGRKHEWKICT